MYCHQSPVVSSRRHDYGWRPFRHWLSTMVILYIDPGAGSLVIQGVLAAVLAIPFFLRSRIFAVVGRLRGRGEPDEHPEETAPGA